MSFQIYLSGSMEHAPDGGVGWRDYLESEYGDDFDFINPHDIETEDMSDEEIADTDREHIRNSQAILISLNDTMEYRGETTLVPMYGTQREHEYAGYNLKMPVVIWYDDDIDEMPLWAKTDVDFRSPNLDDCVAYLQRVSSGWDTAQLLKESAGVDTSHDSYMNVNGVARTWNGE